MSSPDRSASAEGSPKAARGTRSVSFARQFRFFQDKSVATGRSLRSPLAIALHAGAALMLAVAVPLIAQNSASAPVRQAQHNAVAPNAVPSALGRNARASSTGHRSTRRVLPPDFAVLYENGPINGTIDAWTINQGFVASDSFLLPAGGTINAIAYGAWVFAGDVVEQVEVSITSTEFGGTTFFDQVVSFSQDACADNQFGFNTCTETGTFTTSVNLPAGTYWVNLSNAVVSTGDPTYWDENSGMGCHSEGCPSLASENSVGTIPSESFTLFGPLIPTQTTLMVSPNPVPAGQSVTLTATVLGNAEIVSLGTVTFFDGTQVLGTVQANTSGVNTAVLNTRFGSGTHNLTAHYNANDTYAASQSNPVALTVTGTEPTISTLTAMPDGRNSDFTLSVLGFGFMPLAGTATLNNLTQGGLLVGNIGIAGPGVPGFQPAMPFPTGQQPYLVATGDFRGVGILDLAVADLNANTVSILLGNGDGTFQPQQLYAAGTNTVGIVAADFNGDGIPDLAVTNESSNTVSVLLGLGNGSFQPPQPYGVGIEPYGIGAIDSGNGFASLAVTNFHDATISLLLNNNGVFQLPPPTYGVGNRPHAIVVADFNGDGIPDLAVANGFDDTVSVLLGNLGGTFQPQQTYAAGPGPLGLVAADLNGDGVPDLAVVDNTSSTVSVLLGGTVSTGQLINVPVYGVGNQNIRSTFAPSGNFYTGSQSNIVTVGGSGLMTTFSQLTPSQTIMYRVPSVTLSGVICAPPSGPCPPMSEPVTVTIQGQSPQMTTISDNNGHFSTTYPTGGIPASQTPYAITYNYAGDSNFAPATDSSTTLTVVQATTMTVTTAMPPSPSQLGQPVTFTATVTGANGGSPGGTVTFLDNGVTITNCSNLMLSPLPNGGSTASCLDTSLAVGSHSIVVNYSGDLNFLPGSSTIPYQVLAPTGTSITLLVTPTNTTAGQVVTLSASVLSNDAPVPVGTVTFLSGTQPLGTVQIVMTNGTATLLTRFAPGTYQLTAVYNSNVLYSSSTSSPQPLRVTGTEPTTCTLSAQPDGNNFDFSLSTFGFGFPPLAGSAPLTDLTQNNMPVGTIPVPGLGTSSFQSAMSFSAGSLNPIQLTAGDFNGDGIPDLVTSDYGFDIVSVLLGNGDGTFQMPRTYTAEPDCYGITNADFNGDGKLDLALACLTGGLSVLTGNGDGIFQQPTIYPTGNFFPYVIAAGDFNSDGVPDLVTATPQGQVAVFLNNGSGGFTLQQLFPSGTQANAIAVGDFNRDGHLDVAVADMAGNAVVLLGNGDGSFQPAQMFPVGHAPAGIAVADLRRIGILDLVLTNSEDGTVSVLLGNGDGTFQPQRIYGAGSRPDGIVIADFNGDGMPDLAVSDNLLGAVIVLLGNGDGTFQTQQPPYQLATNSFPVGIVAADFNGDGVPDLATGNSGLNNTSVLLGGTVSTGQLLNTTVTGNGPQNLQADFMPTGSIYAASLCNVTVTPIPQMPTTTTLTSSGSPSNLGQPVTFTATVTSSPLPPSGAVAFTSNGMTIPECPNPVPLMPVGTLMQASCTTQSLACGTDNIQASFHDPQGVFANSSARLTQTVQGCPGTGDFEILPINPSSMTVTQSYSNTTEPFFTQAVLVTVHALNGYHGNVMLSCILPPALSSGSCVLNPPSGPVDADLLATLTVTAAAGTQIGNYMITVSGQDNNGLMHQASQNLTVIQYGPGISMPPGGGGGPIIVNFPGPPPNPITPSCTLVNGTGLNGNQPLSMIGGVCTFSPPTGTGPFMLVISGCEVARLHTHMPIYASFFLGLPGLVLLGSLAGGRSRRRKLLQVVGLMMLAAAMLWAVGCGGYGQLTPTGNYQVLVQGTGPDGTVYSAVVPVTVTPLH